MGNALPHDLGNYEPLLELASGGMATVYVARQLGAGGFERVVVLKRVHPHLLRNQGFRDMFRDEARIAAIVRHPNVVSVSDVIEAERELLLVMDYVDASSLSTLRKAASEAGSFLPPAVAVRILFDSLAGLHAAHEAVDPRGHRLELVHRDVSPQNILVGVDGASRLIDFGVAKATNRIIETQSGSVKGKYAYMSPEQTRGEPLDRRTDLFAAGVVLWEVLTGRKLFDADNELAVMRLINDAPLPAPSSINPAIPAALDSFLAKALQRSREERFQTAEAMQEALELALRPAPHREVAAALEALCGTWLGQRREMIAQAISQPPRAGFEPPSPPRSLRVPPPRPTAREQTPARSSSRSRSAARIEPPREATASFAPDNGTASFSEPPREPTASFSGLPREGTASFAEPPREPTAITSTLDVPMPPVAPDGSRGQTGSFSATPAPALPSATPPPLSVASIPMPGALAASDLSITETPAFRSSNRKWVLAGVAVAALSVLGLLASGGDTTGASQPPAVSASASTPAPTAPLSATATTTATASEAPAAPSAPKKNGKKAPVGPGGRPHPELQANPY